MSQRLDSLRRGWRQRAPRERRLALLAAAIVGAALLGQGGAWLVAEQARLARAVPAAAARVKALQAAAAEYAALAARPTAASAAPGSALAALAPLAASLQARGLPLELRLEGSAVRLRGVAPFDGFVAWLAEEQATRGLRVTHLQLTREGALARIDAVLGASAP